MTDDEQSIRSGVKPAVAPAFIAAVAKGSPAAAAGIEPGERLAAICGAPVRDYADYKFLSAEERVEVEVLRPDGARRVITIRKHPDEDLGLGFLTDLFDGMRRCRNRCVFCFYDQLPPGLRPTLYLRDDDLRLSFLHGNFITLTNLREKDFVRIAEQRLSPLYISVHATDPALRGRLLGNPHAPDILAQMRRLAEAGIEMHAQVVLCPGLNDGAVLERTIGDLAALHPAVASLAIVPVGLTRHRVGLTELRPVDAAAARQLLRRVRAWQKDFVGRAFPGAPGVAARAGTRALHARLVFASDELYALAGEDFPAAAEYEGFPQRDNGVGLARLFLDELESVDFRSAGGLTVTLVTGMAASALAERMAAKMREQGVCADVVAVSNSLLGDTITVAGLLAGADVGQALAQADLGDIIAVPSSALRDGEFLDSVTAKELSRSLGKRIIHAAGPRELARKLRAGARRGGKTRVTVAGGSANARVNAAPSATGGQVSGEVYPPLAGRTACGPGEGAAEAGFEPSLLTPTLVLPRLRGPRSPASSGEVALAGGGVEPRHAHPHSSRRQTPPRPVRRLP